MVGFGHNPVLRQRLGEVAGPSQDQDRRVRPACGGELLADVLIFGRDGLHVEHNDLRMVLSRQFHPAAGLSGLPGRDTAAFEGRAQHLAGVL